MALGQKYNWLLQGEVLSTILRVSKTIHGLIIKGSITKQAIEDLR